MELKFASYYDITEVAKSHNEEYKQYERIFFCVDVLDFWICRIQKGWRNDDDEGYVEDENSVILERNKVSKPSKASGIENKRQLLNALNEDDFGNWDVINCESVEEAVEMIDGGFGIYSCETGEPIEKTETVKS